MSDLIRREDAYAAIRGLTRHIDRIAAIRALPAVHLATNAELEALKKAAGIPHLPTQLTFEARLAIGGEGPRAYDWSDKPHRIVYDLCREIEKNAALPVVQPDREHVAFSMWKAEADRAAPNVGKHRTPRGFAEASDQDRTRWLMLADAAIHAMVGESHE